MPERARPAVVLPIVLPQFSEKRSFLTNNPLAVDDPRAVLEAWVKAHGGSKVIRKILISNNGRAFPSPLAQNAPPDCRSSPT